MNKADQRKVSNNGVTPGGLNEFRRLSNQKSQDLLEEYHSWLSLPTALPGAPISGTISLPTGWLIGWYLAWSRSLHSRLPGALPGGVLQQLGVERHDAQVIPDRDALIDTVH